MAEEDDDDLLPRPRVYIYGRAPPPLDPDSQVRAADLPAGPSLGPAAGSPFEPDTFGERYFERAGDPGLLQRAREPRERALRAEEAAKARGMVGMHFDPRPENFERITDERGMSLPELQLKAEFIRSRNLWDPAYQRGIPSSATSPLVAGTALAGVSPDRPTSPYVLKPDLRNETPLTPSEQKDYDRWARSMHKNPKDEEGDYDLKGYWKDVVRGNPDLPDTMKDAVLYHRDQLKKMGPGAHLPDMYKKPNHPTFSDESIYHESNIGGQEMNHGGHWDMENKTFTPGPTNQVHWSRAELQRYFDKYEKGYTVKFPAGYK
jgi:hypothetical protein